MMFKLQFVEWLLSHKWLSQTHKVYLIAEIQVINNYNSFLWSVYNKCMHWVILWFPLPSIFSFVFDIKYAYFFRMMIHLSNDKLQLKLWYITYIF